MTTSGNPSASLAVESQESFLRKIKIQESIDLNKWANEIEFKRKFEIYHNFLCVTDTFHFVKNSKKLTPFGQKRVMKAEGPTTNISTPMI